MIEFQTKVGLWHAVRFPECDPLAVYTKLVSEIGELGDALLGEKLGGKGDVRAELADCLICLAGLAQLVGVDLLDSAERKFPAVMEKSSGQETMNFESVA